MAPVYQGTASYPGIYAYEDFTFTDVSGISPAIAVMTVYPQNNVPPSDGDIVLRYGPNTITLKNMHIDAADFERNTSGQIVKIRFQDERWKWQFGDITGKYNFKLPNNWIDPDHEKTPRELARLCFDAMGVTQYSTAALPDDARPEVDWDHANPALALQQLCEDLGCRIVPKRSTGEWIICVTGEGMVFPDQGWPYQDPSEGINPKERPDYIKIVTAPWRYQVALPLEPVGRDIDHVWRRINYLTYRPGNISDYQDAYGFGPDPFGMSAIDPTRVRQADGTAISPRELALQTVFKCWRISGSSHILDADDPLLIPGYGEALRKQLLVSDELVQVYLDEKGGEHKRPAYCFGRFFLETAEGVGNSPHGMRIDRQVEVFQEMEDERASFSIHIDPLDTTRTIVTISKPIMVRNPPEITGKDFAEATSFFLMCTVNVRDPDTWQPHRYEHLVQVGPGTDEKNCFVAIKDDIQPWTIGKYDEFGDLQSFTENIDEVQRQCNYYAAAIAKTFEIVGTLRRTYIGLYPVDMDGLTCQVTWRISKQGADTIVSAGTEHDFDIPTYDESRKRWARRAEGDFMKVVIERQKRLDRLKGTSDTI